MAAAAKPLRSHSPSGALKDVKRPEALFSIDDAREGGLCRQESYALNDRGSRIGGSRVVPGNHLLPAEGTVGRCLRG
jgi:hypothetical protein